MKCAKDVDAPYSVSQAFYSRSMVLVLPQAFYYRSMCLVLPECSIITVRVKVK